MSITPNAPQRTRRNTADVPPPPDSTQVDSDWDLDGERHFWGTDREGVFTAGFQKADGSVRARWIQIDHPIDELSAAEARSYAARLIAAADELDRLQGTR